MNAISILTLSGFDAVT